MDGSSNSIPVIFHDSIAIDPKDDATDPLQLQESPTEELDRINRLSHSQLRKNNLNGIELHHTLQQREITLSNGNVEIIQQSVDTITTSEPAHSVANTQSTRIYSNWISAYFSKWQGQHQQIPPRHSIYELVYGFIGAFLGIAFPALIQFNWFAVNYAQTDYTMIIGSFGASAVLIYSAIDSPFSQPRNVLGGHMISAFVGVCVRKIIPWSQQWLACSLAVSIAVVSMAITRTIHPPGGATALIAVLASPAIQELGFLYVVFPVGSGICMMLLVAVIINNIDSRRTWPRYWW